MWMLYAQEHWTKAYDLKSAVERLYEELGALEFDADHEAIYGMKRYYTVQQCEELRDKYKIRRKEKFEMKHIEKKQKEEKKRKSEEAKIQAATKTLFAKKRKAVKEDYTSSEEEEISLDDSSDDATYWIPEVKPSAFEELDRDPKPDDFVLVQFKVKNNVFYVGKVLKLEKGTNDIEVNFLRKSVKFEGHFIFPPKPDIATVSAEDIKIYFTSAIYAT
ncbi:hypothetical protein FQA39_LY14699 [Lamprigera yunnana]|nr:hypothetical protein FQA39_LY14699 [Lamprigera yunnana]